MLDDRVVRESTERATGEDVRRSFSEEWRTYGAILAEHDKEFAAHVDTIVLVDFLDAIFVARANLSADSNAVFFRGDVSNLPFVNDSVDFLFNLGVLHHLDRPCLPATRGLMRLGPRGLFYFSYSLENRPDYFRALLSIVTALRRFLGRVESERARIRIARALACGVYRPRVGLGALAARVSVPAPVPLYESYMSKSVNRIAQDAYD